MRNRAIHVQIVGTIHLHLLALSEEDVGGNGAKVVLTSQIPECLRS